MKEGDGSEPIAAIVAGHGSGKLEETLGTNEVGLEAWTERIATPGDAGGMETGAAEQGVVEKDAERSAGRQLG